MEVVVDIPTAGSSGTPLTLRTLGPPDAPLSRLSGDLSILGQIHAIECFEVIAPGSTAPADPSYEDELAVLREATGLETAGRTVSLFNRPYLLFLYPKDDMPHG